MRDEERRSTVQAMNVSEENFLLGRGEFIGEAEQITVADNEETAWRPSEGEDVVEEEAAVPPGRPDEEPDIPENRSAEHIQVVIDNLPVELTLISVWPPRSSFVTALGCFRSQIIIYAERTWSKT